MRANLSPEAQADYRERDRLAHAAIPLEVKRAYNAQWRETVSEEWRDAKRAYNRERSRQLREADPDQQARYRMANLARARERDHLRYQRDREVRIAAASHYARIRRMRLAGRPVLAVTERDWQRLVARYRGCCAYCGRQTVALQREHVIPVARGGRHAIGNLLPACRPCNLSKGARLIVEWRARQRMGLAA